MTKRKSGDFATDYQAFIHKGRYAKWRDELLRRETWPETVDRYLDFFADRVDLPSEILMELRYAIINQDIMPSMRCMMTAGKALARDEVSGYNCAYRAMDDIRAFDEMMYVLMCGTGVGFSVERQYITNLPEIAEEFYPSDTTIIVPDSKLGWSSSYRELISLLYSGKVPKWDVSRVRPAGARLKTFGGRASGPEPLEDLFRFSIGVFQNAAGRKLNSLEVHDLACKVADIVVVGGVRRSALISLSNLTDERMRHAKQDMYYTDETGAIKSRAPQRELANNSVCYTEKPDVPMFLREMRSLFESHSGERGIFSREAAQRHVATVLEGRRDPEQEFGTNPCSEILLRSQQFCNLSEVVVRQGDTPKHLARKVRLATILGTMQATLTNFRYLSKKWKTNTKEEALLGVSLTGIMDHLDLSGEGSKYDHHPCYLPELLTNLKQVAVDTNAEYAERFGINPAAAITCVKPSGTVSQLVNSASGIHARHSQYYIRRVRTDKKDPIYAFLKDKGVPVEDVIGKEDSTAVFSFPVASPEGCITRNDRTAVEQLELWKTYAENWCEHKPSITVYYKESEFLDVVAWLHNNFDLLSGISVLPMDGGVYPQAPYEEIDHAAYQAAVEAMPDEVDWAGLEEYETEDNMTVEHELACSAGGCEIV